MRVLVGCEESGVVRNEFIARGHVAYSNDLVPARNGGPHLQMDVFNAIVQHGPWDLIILHPPCTALCVSGNRTYGWGKPKHNERLASIYWTVNLWNLATSRAPKVILENPVGVIWKHIGQPQYIQPWMFGHMETKKTGLLLHNLEPLRATNNVFLQMTQLPKAQRNRIHYMSPGPNRARDRSETYTGIAQALGAQYG